MAKLLYRDPNTQQFLPLVLGGVAATKYAFSYRRTTNQTLSVDGWTTVLMDSRVFDDSGAYNPTTGIWTAPASGVVHFTGQVMFVFGSSTNTTVTLSVWLCDAAGTPVTEVLRGDGWRYNVSLNDGYSISLAGDLLVTAGSKYCLMVYAVMPGFTKTLYNQASNRWEGFYLNQFITPVVPTPVGACTLQKTINTPISANIWSEIPFDYEEIDSTGDMHSAAFPNRIYVRRSGLYSLTASLAISPATACYMRFGRNTATVPGRVQFGSATEYAFARITPLNAGDYVTTQAYVGAAVNVTVGAVGSETNPHFSVVEMR